VPAPGGGPNADDLRALDRLDRTLLDVGDGYVAVAEQIVRDERSALSASGHEQSDGSPPDISRSKRRV